MSTVTITHHNENIKNILDPPAPLMQPSSCGSCHYISKFRPKVLRDEKKGKECHKTFGYANVPLPKPCEFLRKHNRIVPPRPVVGPKCSRACQKTAVPDKSCQVPVTTKKVTCGPKTCTKNFQMENIHRVKHSVPRQPLPRFVDSPKGHSQPLLPSGLLPIYVHKKNYGKVPCYIYGTKVCQQENVCQPGQGEGPGIHPIPEEERLALLEGLRKNWNELQTAYQHMPILTDTEYKRIRKDRMERELRRLEINISTLERHDQIYVIDDEAT